MEYGSLLFYTVIFVLSSGIASFTRTEKKIKASLAFLIAVLIPSVMAGIRYFTGTDYINYLRLYNEIALYGYSRTTPDLEIGYVFINRICNNLGIGYQGVLFVMSWITNYYALKAIIVYKEKFDPGLSYFLYLICYYQASYNLIRQAAAMTITLYALTKLEKGKIREAIVYVIVAFLFHSSAIIILLPIITYMLYKSNLSRYIKRIYTVTVAIVLFFYDTFFALIANIVSLPSRYIGYIERGQYEDFGFTVFIRFGYILLPFLLIYKRYKKENRMVYPFVLFTFGFVFRLATYSATFSLAVRMVYYFQIYQIFCVPLLFEYFKEHSYIKKDYIHIISKTIVLVAIVFWIYDAFILGVNETVPYRSVLGI